MGNMKLGPVGSYATLYPIDYSFPEQGKVLRQRTETGALFQYGIHYFNKFEIKLTYVHSYDASLINSWWEAGTQLRFIEDDSNNNSYDVLIVNRDKPLNQYSKVYRLQQLQGELLLEEY